MAIDQASLDEIFKAALQEADRPIRNPRPTRNFHRVTPTTMETTAAANAALATPPPQTSANTLQKKDISSTATNSETTRKTPNATPAASPASKQAADPETDDKPQKNQSSKRTRNLAAFAIIIAAAGGAGWFTQPFIFGSAEKTSAHPAQPHQIQPVESRVANGIITDGVITSQGKAAE